MSLPSATYCPGFDLTKAEKVLARDVEMTSWLKTDKWAEEIDQALHHASQTGKTPGIVLICESKKALKTKKRKKKKVS